MSKRQYRLLMIDDDAALNELLVEYFDRFGHKLATAATAADGRRMLRRDDPDLLILDVMLPDGDGMELCRTIRAESDIPILMLTARGDLPDRILGLEFGNICCHRRINIKLTFLDKLHYGYIGKQF